MGKKWRFSWFPPGASGTLPSVTPIETDRRPAPSDGGLFHPLFREKSIETLK
jgi:hypothetical protein